jgi:hypothetical protein
MPFELDYKRKDGLKVDIYYVLCITTCSITRRLTLAIKSS